MERIVLAYSGGLDTSVAIPWLKEKYDAEIIAVTMDLGQGKELEEVRDRALATGAVRAHVLELLPLPQIHRHRDDLGVVFLLEPGNRHRSIKSTGICQNDPSHNTHS